MELRHLRYFVAIAEERSFTRAADRLWVAQPGLSTQIRRLEAELGVQLFERHTRGVDLTAAGELFLERARTAIAAADAASATGRDIENGLVGAVRLGLTTPRRWHRTSMVLERFTAERRGVELTVLEGYGGTLWRDLRDGRLDAVIAPSDLASPDLRRIEVGRERWAVLIGRDHPLSGIGPVTAGDLKGEQIVVTGHRDGAGYDRAVREMLGELAVPVSFVAVGPEHAMQRAVAQGRAVSLTTAPEALPPGVIARPLQPERAMTFAVLWRGETPSPALREFIRIVADCADVGSPSRSVLAVAA
jgi:DNA-binding transcriptional LysR family regulator